MTIIEAKEILVKAHICLRKPYFINRCVGRKNCENCQFYVTYEQEKKAHEYLSELCQSLYPDCCSNDYEIENIYTYEEDEEEAET